MKRRVLRLFASAALGIALALVLALVAARLGGPTPVSAPASTAAQAPELQGFDFALIGDLGYGSDFEPAVANVLDALNDTPLSFVVHDGDLGDPTQGSCTDAHMALRLAQFQASTHPFIYTPGDNDWTDCHPAHGAGNFDPIERLNHVRQLFFPNNLSLGQEKLPLTQQSQNPAYAKFRENVRWDFGGVTFMTLNVPGSNNNLGRVPEMDAEYFERNAADIAWLRDGFAWANSQGSAAVMIVIQANIFPELPPDAGNPVQNSGFTDLRSALAAETIAFGKPVVLVHGDSHYFRMDKPLKGATTGTVENFTRVETFGQPNHHWVLATVDPTDPNVFIFRQRMVDANVVDHAPDLGRSWGP